MHFILMKFDILYTLVHKIYFLFCPSVKFDPVIYHSTKSNVSLVSWTKNVKYN